MSRPPRSLQDLPPHGAHFCLGVERFVLRELLGGAESGPPGATPPSSAVPDNPFAHTLVAACSGGADSTALVLVLQCLTRRHGGRVLVAHLDHGLRAESGEDARFVAELCAALDLECVRERRDVAALARDRRLGLEDAGRAARYALLERLRRERDAALVCTAHQLDDLAEDVLLRLTRGAGWPGLGGLPGYDPGRHLLRPLLLTPKAELVAFLRGVGMDWRQDASNALASQTRNRMRHQVLPLLLRENPHFRESVARLWRQARTDEAFWEERVGALRGEACDGGRFFAAGALLERRQAERLRLYKAALDGQGPGQALSDGLHAVDEALTRGRPAVIQFPGLKVARVSARGVWFGPDPRAEGAQPPRSSDEDF